jgi:hypothetical protein
MHPRVAIGIAAATVILIQQWLPFGRELLYPLSLFTTWVHEMGHGLTALLLGGRFTELVIRTDGSGYAMSYAGNGWNHALVSAGGMLAPAILGSFILGFVHGPRRAKIVLTILAAALVLSVVIWVRSTIGVITMPIVAVLLAWAAWLGFRAKPHRRVIMAQVLGVMLAFDTVFGTVFYAMSSEASKGRPSDVQQMANEVGGAYWMHGLVIIAIALSMIAFSLWWAWRRPDPPREADRSPSRAGRANKASR